MSELLSAERLAEIREHEKDYVWAYTCAWAEVFDSGPIIEEVRDLLAHIDALTALARELAKALSGWPAGSLTSTERRVLAKAREAGLLE